MARLYIHFKQNQTLSQMKRFILLLLPLFFLLSPKTTGQNSIPLTNNGFENWSTGNGYSASVGGFISLPVYSSYTYPTGWNYPTYPVDESVTYYGMSVNVNTNLPLLKVSNETSGVPEGSHAVKLQSFMLSDIINSTVYNLASSSLDEWLTTSVFPTVFTTGAVDIDQLLPLVEDFTNNFDSLPLLLGVFDSVDLNSIIDGGVSLNGAAMGRMTGYYKYTSGVGGDHGGIMILGSKYNPATQRREVVGGGFTTELTDVSSYTPFEVTYTPLSELDSTAEYVEADSLVILLFSSATTEAQHGSSLYLDNLQLWAVGEEPPVIIDTTAIECDSFNWYGEDLTSSGDYTHPIENSNSILTLHLTINHSTYNSIDATVCDSYEWHDSTYTESGTYVFEYTNETDCPSADTLHLTVTTIDTYIELHTQVTDDENYVFVTQENAEYQWIDCETNEPIEGETQQQFTPEISGSYACIITLGECADTTECEYVSVGVSISENSATDLILYPNPTTGIVTVQLATETCTLTPEIQMYDIYGRRLQIIPVTAEKNPIDLSQYANGIYFMKLVSDGKVISVGKVVKE